MNTARLKTFRIISVVVLALGTLSLIASTIGMWLLEPADQSATLVDVAVAHQGLFTLVALVVVFGPLLLLAGLPAVVDVARAHGWVLTLIGGCLTGLGLAAGIGHLALYWGLFGDLALAGASGETVQQLGQGDESNPLIIALLIVFLVGLALGPIVLTLGLRRARLVAVWVPVAAIVAAVANYADGIPAGIVQLVAFTAAFVAIIIAVWRGPVRSEVRRGHKETLVSAN